MKAATVRQLRNEFRRLSKWRKKGETIEILKHGKPSVELVPWPKHKGSLLLGVTPSTYPLPSDIDAPVEAEWTALK